MMGADESLAEIFRNLNSWSRLPKYALERRLDIFLTPFIADYLAHEDARGPVTLVVPEFPILAEITDIAAAKTRAEAGERLAATSARTVNADFLLHRGPPNPAWVLLELKTDTASLGKKQLDRYMAAQQLKMAALLDHLEQKVFKSTAKRHRGRYREVIERVKKREADDIEIVYLAPRAVKGLRPAADALRGGDRRSPRCHLLLDFAAWNPPGHASLWGRVRDLVKELGRGSPVIGRNAA